jgi:hypothetical protein
MNDHSTVASTPARRRTMRKGVRTLRDVMAEDVSVPLRVLQLGRDLGRPLTALERLSLAVASVQPTDTLTLGTGNMSQPELATAFDVLREQVERRKHRKGPLIYFASYAWGMGGGGYHMHLILWEEPYRKMYNSLGSRLGITHVRWNRITRDPVNTLRAVRYALAQHESVFGSRKHEENQPREKHKRSYISNQATTLAGYQPELFRVTQMAKDQSLSDVALVSSLPSFIRTYPGISHRPEGVQTAA